MADKDYSSSPLPRKLGIKEGSRVLLVGAPEGLRAMLSPLPESVELMSRAQAVGSVDVIVAFARQLSDLERRFPKLVRVLRTDGGLWVAWPKVASKVETDLAFDLVQALGLRAGLVDNKSASVDDVFQGLRFVYRLKDRPRRPPRH